MLLKEPTSLFKFQTYISLSRIDLYIQSQLSPDSSNAHRCEGIELSAVDPARVKGLNYTNLRGAIYVLMFSSNGRPSAHKQMM